MQRSSILRTIAVVFAVAAFAFTGCDKTEKDPVIELSAPADDVTVDLATSGSIAFSWKKADGVAAYTLRFASTEAGLAESKAALNVEDKVSYVLTAADADAMMAQFTQVKPGASGVIYWTVTGGEAATQVRKINITRLPPKLEIDPAEVEFVAVPTEGQTITVQSNVAWTVTVEPADWLTVTPVSGTADGSFMLTAEPNIETAERTATITVSGEDVADKTIAVTQAAGNGEALFLEVQPGEVAFLAAPDAPKTVTVTTNTTWTATSDVAWLKAEKGDGVVVLTADANTGADARSATVTVAGGGVESKTVSVTQAGANAKFVSLSPGAVEVAYDDADPVSVGVTSNTIWKVSIPDDAKAWIEVTSAGTDGLVAAEVTGNGAIVLKAKANLGAERTAVVTVTGEGAEPQTITVKQLAATGKELTIDNNRGELDHRPNQYYVHVTSNTEWKANIPAEAASWITVRYLNPEGLDVSAPVTGNGTIIIETTLNTGDARTADITVTGAGAPSRTITITQAESVPPYIDAYVSKAIPASGDDMTAFLHIDANVDWSIEIPAAASWLSPNKTSGEAGEQGGVLLTATEHTGETERTATITIKGAGVEDQTVTVTQRGNAPYIELVDVTGDIIMGFEGGESRKVAVYVESNVLWSLGTMNSWLNIARMPDGDGFEIWADENPTTYKRMGTVNVSGGGAANKSVTVIQMGMDVILEALPASATFPATPAAPVEVSVVSNAPWEALAQDNWVIISRGSGTGDGSFTITAQANTGAARSTHVILSSKNDINRTVYIQVSQSGTGGDAGAEELPGTWYLQKADAFDRELGGAFEFLTKVMFTLKADKTYTGEIPIMFTGDQTNNTRMTWEYSGGLFTFTDSEGFTCTYSITETTGQRLVMETGTAGSDGYAKMIYVKTPVTVDPFPETVTPYTGNTDVFVGNWKETKRDICQLDSDDGELRWYFYNLTGSSTITVNADNTWTGGTWEFDPVTGTLTLNLASGGEKVYTVEASSTSSEFVASQTDTDQYGREYTRTTFTRQ